MNKHVYNISILIGVLSMSAGFWMIEQSYGFISLGFLVLFMTVLSARINKE